MRHIIAGILLALATNLAHAQLPTPDPNRPSPTPDTGTLVFFPESIEWVFERSRGLLVAVEAIKRHWSVSIVLPECHHRTECVVTFKACQPLIMIEQSASETVIAASGWTGRQRRDLRSMTYTDRLACEEAAGVALTSVIGIQIQMKNLVIASVLPNSPAALAGIKRGYRVVRIDGQPVNTIEEALRLLGGPPGTEVELVLARRRTERSYTLTRKPWSEIYKPIE